MRLRYRLLNWFIVAGLLMGMLAPVIALSALPISASAEEAAVVEADMDVDGVADNIDNCPEISNPGQEDSDLNGVGDACEPVPTAEVNDPAFIPSDLDADGYADDVDNCPDVYNPEQEDWDGNGVGDACDVPPTGSIIITTYNSTPGEEHGLIAGGCFRVVDSAGTGTEACDGVGNELDGIVEFRDLPIDFYTMYHLSAPEGYVPLYEAFAEGTLTPGFEAIVTSEVQRPDIDADGYADIYDNCPEISNPDQEDGDGNGIGDACEAVPVFEPTLQPTQAPEPVFDPTEAPTPTPTGVPFMDQDLDGLSDEQEAMLGTDPAMQDTDGDGVNDWFEVNHFGTDPLQADEYPDSDGDGLPDVMEAFYGTDALNPDSDADGLTDGEEMSNGSDPLNASSPGSSAPVETPPGEDWPQGTPGPITGNTVSGTNVEVAGVGNGEVTLVFGEVLVPGETTVNMYAQPSDLPGEYDTAAFMDITTTAVFAGPVTICVDYHYWYGFLDNATVKIFHDAGNGWTDITTSIDVAAGRACGLTESFSPFAISFTFAPQDSATPQVGATPLAATANTQAGSGVEVSGLGDGQVSVTFEEVITPGDTWAEHGGFPDPATMPAGYSYLGAFIYNVETTAEYAGGITVCVAYYPPQYTDPSSIQLFHDGGNGWEMVTTSNTWEGEAGVVCGVTTGLSPFMVAAETPVSSLQIVAQDWYGNPVPNAALLVYQNSCGEGEPVSVTTDQNGVALLENLQPYTSYCITDGSTNPPGYAWLEEGQVNTALVMLGEKPAEGYIVLVLQDEIGNPIPVEQLTSNACVHAYNTDTGVNACDNSDGVIDGRITFGGWPVTTWTLSNDYRAPYGYQVVEGDLPTEISGFVPGESREIGVRHTAFASPSTSIIVNVVDSQDNPVPGGCFTVWAVENSGGCDAADGNNDGRVFVYGPFAPGEYELASYMTMSGGLNGPISQTVTVEPGATLVYTTVLVQPSLLVVATDNNGNPVTSCFWVEGDAFQGEACDGRDGVDGVATVYGLPDGEYTVSMPYVPPGYTTDFTSASVSVTSGTVAQVDVPFAAREDVTLTVTVTDENGAPLPNSCIYVQSTSSWDAEGACTDAQGVARFYVMTGEVMVYLSSPVQGYAQVEAVTITVEETPTLTLVSRKLNESVVVQVTDTSGGFIPDACVDITNNQSYYQACDVWDVVPNNGEIVFHELMPGDYNLRVWSPSGKFDSYTAEITIETGAPVMEIQASLAPNATYTTLAQISSVDASGNLLPGACYTLLFPGHGVWTQCDAADGANDGITTFGSAWETYFNGEYTLIQGKAPDGAPAADNQTFTVGSERPVEVTVTHDVWAMETGTGTAVTVTPSGNTGVALTFDNVVAGGTTTVQPVTVEDVPELSPEFSLDGAVFFEIATTATFDGAVAVCLPYNSADFDRPQDLALLHYENGAWTDVTVSNDPVVGIICGSVSSFSPFALVKKAEAPNTAPVLGSVIRVPTGQVATGTSVGISASFTDVDTEDTHTATIDWGDGVVTTGTVTENDGAGTITGTHTYTAAGVYHVTVTVADDEGAASTSDIAVTIDVKEAKPAKPPKSSPKPPRK